MGTLLLISYNNMFVVALRIVAFLNRISIKFTCTLSSDLKFLPVNAQAIAHDAFFCLSRYFLGNREDCDVIRY